MSRLELKKVFNLLIISEVKIRKYIKSDEYENWATKAQNARLPGGPPSDGPTGDAPPSDGPPSDGPSKDDSPTDDMDARTDDF